MATAYLARDVRHNRKVAPKVLSPELGAVLGAERFLAEIEVTANLQRPNLLAGEFTTDASHANYDIAPDGRFVMLRRTGAEAEPIVVYNWSRELHEKAAPRK